jgi:hypothetical protein
MAGAHGDEHRDAVAHLLRVHQRHPLADDARLLEALDPAPGGVVAEPHPLAERLHRHGGVGLQACRICLSMRSSSMTANLSQFSGKHRTNWEIIRHRSTNLSGVFNRS